MVNNGWMDASEKKSRTEAVAVELVTDGRPW